MTIRKEAYDNCPADLRDALKLEEMCLHPERYKDTEVIHRGRNIVLLYTDHATGRKYVVKNFKKPNLAQRIAYTWFTPGKARRAFKYASMLRSRGISTPRETAYIEVYEHGLLSQSYFVCEYCPWPSLASLWLPSKPYDIAQLETVAQMLADMHRAGVLHGDTNIGNFLYGAPSSITTVDVNRTRFLNHEPTRKECLDNMVKLTHRRDVLYKITEHYADIRGWNKQESADYVLHKLIEYEKKRNRRNKLKHIAR